MRKTILALAACTLALASCQTADLDSTVKASLPKTCELIATAHAAFLAVSASGNIRKKTIREEAAAYAGVQSICANPGNVTASTALVAAAQAYATISLALKSAR